MTAVLDSETSKLDAHRTIGWRGEYFVLLTGVEYIFNSHCLKDCALRLLLPHSNRTKIMKILV